MIAFIVGTGVGGGGGGAAELYRTEWWPCMNIRINHGFSVFNVCCGPRSIFMLDAKQRALISIEGRNQC